MWISVAAFMELLDMMEMEYDEKQTIDDTKEE